jgi:hypothetical protein
MSMAKINVNGNFKLKILKKLRSFVTLNLNLRILVTQNLRTLKNA